MVGREAASAAGASAASAKAPATTPTPSPTVVTDPGAARAAARDLSIARDPQAATDEVRRDAEVSLEVGSPTCRSMTFTPTISFTEVSVSIACVVDLQDAAVLPVPATMTLTADATEILDVHRETDTAFGIP